MTRARCYLVAGLLVWLSACGGALPPDAGSAALHRDLERLVELADTEGWSVDRIEVEEALPAALLSLCRSSIESRGILLSWLDQRIDDEGGSVREVYERRSRDLGSVSHLLSLTRIRMLLSRAMATAEADCPFWLHATPNFSGRQILDDRWFISVGGGGKGIVVRQNAENDLHFGGAGRFLVGRGFGRHATLLAGLELGVGAALPGGDDGGAALQVALDTVVPLVYRHRLVNTYWEAEAGYIAHTAEEDLETAHGVHVGLSVGGSAARRRWIFPGAAFGISYERIAEDKILHVVKVGFRVAFDLAL